MAARIVLFVMLYACCLGVTHGQGLILSEATTLGASSTVAQLQKILSASRAWKQAYRQRPAAACSQSGTLCSTTTSSIADSSRYAQLMLATSPAVYETSTLSPVQTQSDCNSCTAFAVTAAAEVAIATVLKVKDFSLNSLSPQDFYFCAQDSPRACSTGWSLPNALRELQDRQKKLLTRRCMPYKPDFKEELRQDELCAAQCNSTNPYAQLGKLGYKRLGTLWAVQAHIRQYGAAVARFDVYDDLDVFFRETGNIKKVYAPRDKAKLLQYHAVIITGYNNAEGFWLVQSSWGPEYADNGRFRVAFGAAALGTEVYGVVFDPDAFGPGAAMTRTVVCVEGSAKEVIEKKNKDSLCATATSAAFGKRAGRSFVRALYRQVVQYLTTCSTGIVNLLVDDSVLLCATEPDLPTTKQSHPPPLVTVNVNWESLMLNVTPWSPSCYRYTAVDGDSLSLVAWKAGVPLERLMLDNAGAVNDLDTPITGKQLALCFTDGKSNYPVHVPLYGVVEYPKVAGPGPQPKANSCSPTSLPGAVSALKVAKLGATGLIISWSAPDRSQCVTATHVSITYKYTPETKRTAQPVNVAIVETPLAPEVRLKCCLIDGVAYVLRVAARNAAGLGPVVTREVVYGNL